MANARNADFTLVDYTDEIGLYPKVWSLISGMGLFEPHYIDTTLAQVEFVQEKLADIEARKRGGDRNYVTSEDASTYNLNIPFFPLDRGITASDIQNFREYGSGNESKTVMTEVDRVMRRIRGSQAQLKEKAMSLALQGTGFGAGYTYATTFSQTQPLAPVDFTATTVNPADTLEELARRVIIRNAQDGTDSNAVYSVMAICGEDYFSALIGHPMVEDAYASYESQQEPLRKRLGMSSEDDSVRVFKYKGITFVEDLSPTQPVGEATIFPMNMPDMFRVYYAPADDLDYANTAGQELYMWYKEDRFNRQYKVESETSFLCVNTRIDLTVKSVGTF